MGPRRKGRIRCLEGRESRLEGDGQRGLTAQLVEGEVLPPKLADEGIPARGREQLLHRERQRREFVMKNATEIPNLIPKLPIEKKVDLDTGKLKLGVYVSQSSESGYKVSFSLVMM